MAFTTKAAQTAFREAVAEIEKTSSIEVVVAVRPRLRRWPGANGAIAVTCAIAALAFTLFADTEFDLWEILVFPWFGAIVGGLLVELIPPLGRVLTPRRVRAQNLHEASRATFVDLGVHRTRGRTGLLVFLAVREQVAALVGDAAVIDQVGQHKLDQLAAKLAPEIPAGGEAVARVLRGFDFSSQLPRAADDINELPDDMHVMRRPRRRARVAS